MATTVTVTPDKDKAVEVRPFDLVNGSPDYRQAEMLPKGSKAKSYTLQAPQGLVVREVE